MKEKILADIMQQSFQRDNNNYLKNEIYDVMFWAINAIVKENKSKGD